MRVAITGSSGLIGTALRGGLDAAEHQVVRVTRPGSSAPGTIAWDIDAGTIDGAGFDGVDAVIHLAGEGIAERRWSDEQKRRIRDSRIRGTALLATALAELEQPPSVLLSGSAVGFYGDRGDETLTEESTPGTGFLADVCRDWEAAAEPAIDAGIRVAHLRMGVVLSRDGGALAKQLPLFKLGLGGRVG
ncbi:MAG: NAD-dependent epimerase/dehydratase family protein, partial [Acidimicrobiia bacterium]|nr:NAD-dependent epimerase/dehydratase family protein [Acidimicrobiia bacterium]